MEKSLRVLGAGATVDSGEKDSNDDEGVKEESESTAKESTFDSSKKPSSHESKPEQTEVHKFTGSDFTVNLRLIIITFINLVNK